MNPRTSNVQVAKCSLRDDTEQSDPRDNVVEGASDILPPGTLHIRVSSARPSRMERTHNPYTGRLLLLRKRFKSPDRRRPKIIFLDPSICRLQHTSLRRFFASHDELMSLTSTEGCVGPFQQVDMQAWSNGDLRSYKWLEMAGKTHALNLEILCHRRFNCSTACSSTRPRVERLPEIAVSYEQTVF